jgi:hypothetical protein
VSRDERGRDDGGIDHGHRGHARTGRAAVALFPTRIDGGGVDTGLGRQYDVTRDGQWNPEAKP